MNCDGFVTRGRESTGKAAGPVATASISSGEKALHLVKRILLKQYGILWYNGPVFEFSAGKDIRSMAQSVALIPILMAKVNFFS
jgi:hypothetical protein